MANTFAIGDRVLNQSDLRHTWVVVDRFDTPCGARLAVELAHRPGGAAPIQLAARASEFIACPDDWRDAPQRPACRDGRFDGSAQDEDAISKWLDESRQWDADYRQVLLEKMRRAAT